ncbi:U3 small nucleolar RNA-associated protein 11 [Ceratocystis fimbriata CBS 114723]|uniref:U3 small nucleolar RNA-associated protein 11 n=3 Tax=Ceratocystis TaxID=5157 RepID=A0A2C5XIP4_9PEZI|nr:putative U3 small nucleolar RNA-associated protein 11 [Ceratocystis platani]PHH55773.1 U3 small nucleolar RNA-associated protein 11 [Ceratocystis fimbriata CBS 114723]
MSSTMRNAVQRRPHRERAQPLERKKYGLLEKKKDYTLRAKDFNKKKAQLKNLRAKAAERNEDEFYFGMMSRSGPGSRLSRGRSFNGMVDGDRGNKVLDQETARLLKTQDISYIRSVRTHLAKDVQRLREQIVLAQGISEAGVVAADHQPKTGKVIFAEDEEERAQMLEGLGDDGDEEEDDDDDFDMAGFDPTNMDDFGGWSSSEDEDDSNNKDKNNDGKKDQKAAEKEMRLRKLNRKLEAMEQKLGAIARAEQLMAEQQAKMAKTATSGGVTKKGKKLLVRTRKR